MSDFERLDEALEWVDSGPTVVGAEHIIALASAARAYRDLLANGVRVWWCNGTRSTYSMDMGCADAGYGNKCGWRLLVDPTAEEE